MNSPIKYSRGKARHDNQPKQKEASCFIDFAEAVLNDVSQIKGLTYVCGPFNQGFHHNRDKYPNEGTYRINQLAQPRFFLPFDLDGFANKDIFPELLDWLTLNCQFFAYTTASSTDEAPRCRLVLAQSRETSPDEGKALCEAIQAQIEHVFGIGAIVFDTSVYSPAQALYTPMVGARTVQSFTGKPIDVDATLVGYIAPVKVASTDVENAALKAFSLIGKVNDLGSGKFAVTCPFEEEHSKPRSDDSDSSTVYYLPNYNGYTTGNCKCVNQRPILSTSQRPIFSTLSVC